MKVRWACSWLSLCLTNLVRHNADNGSRNSLLPPSLSRYMKDKGAMAVEPRRFPGPCSSNRKGCLAKCPSRCSRRISQGRIRNLERVACEPHLLVLTIRQPDAEC